VWLYKGEIRKDGKVDEVLDEYLKVCGWLTWRYLKNYITIEN
jgi:ABC-type polysaccharide/polyol phosphate transport system ATPase subunit